MINTSARHVFETLYRVCRAGRPVAAAELRDRLGLPSSTVHRALATLEEEGYIARYRGQSAYVIGQHPQHLAHALFNQFPIRRTCHAMLREVARRHRLTVLLTMRVGWCGIKVALLEGSNEVFHAGALGEMRWLAADAAGCEMLAAMPADDSARARAFAARHRPLLAPADGTAEQAAGGSDWTWTHLPVRDGGGTVVAAVSGGAPADAAGAPQRAAALGNAVKQIEQCLRDQPELAQSPFEHLPEDGIVPPGWQPISPKPA